MIATLDRSHTRSGLSPVLHRFVPFSIAVAAVVAAGCSAEEKTNPDDGLTVDTTTVPSQDTARSDEVCI
jgi:hypothetical protein